MSRSPSSPAVSTRAQRERIAAELRAQGLLMREIAERMGMPRSTVADYLSDPGGHKLRARKDSYRGICPECGGPTDGSNGRSRRTVLCSSCRAWPVEQIVAAMQAWAVEHGRAPRCDEWRGGNREHPCSTSVRKRIGWNKALRLAGLPVTRDPSPETQEWIVEQIRAGRPIADIAAERGWTPQAISARLRNRGLSVREIRAAA